MDVSQVTTYKVTLTGEEREIFTKLLAFQENLSDEQWDALPVGAQKILENIYTNCRAFLYLTRKGFNADE